MNSFQLILKKLADSFAPPPDALDAPTVYIDRLPVDMTLLLRKGEGLGRIRDVALHWAQAALPNDVGSQIKKNWYPQSYNSPTASFEAIAGKDAEGRFLWAFRFGHQQKNMPERVWLVDGALSQTTKNEAQLSLRLGTCEPEHALRVPLHNKPNILTRLENMYSVVVDGEPTESNLSFINHAESRGAAKLVSYIFHKNRTRPIILAPLVPKEETEGLVGLSPIAKELGTFAHIYLCAPEVLQRIYGEIGDKFAVARGEMRILRPGFSRHDSTEMNPVVSYDTATAGGSVKKHVKDVVWPMLIARPDIETAVPHFEAVKARIVHVNRP